MPVAAAFLGVYLLFVGTTRGQWADELALRGARLYLKGLPADAGLELLNRLPEVVAVLCAVGLVVFGALRRDIVGPVVALAAAGASMAATQLLKHQILDRPAKGVSEAWGNSFPSGHTTVAAAAVVALVLTAPRSARPWLALAGSVAAAVTGGATLVMGWHRPSDIVGAFLVAVFFGLLAAAVLAALGRDARDDAVSALPAEGPAAGPAKAGGLTSAVRKAGSAGRRIVWATVGLGALLCVAAAFMFGSRSGSTGHVGPQDPAWFLTSGLVLIAGAALLLFPLMERLIDASLFRPRRALP